MANKTNYEHCNKDHFETFDRLRCGATLDSSMEALHPTYSQVLGHIPEIKQRFKKQYLRFAGDESTSCCSILRADIIPGPVIPGTDPEYYYWQDEYENSEEGYFDDSMFTQIPFTYGVLGVDRLFEFHCKVFKRESSIMSNVAKAMWYLDT